MLKLYTDARSVEMLSVLVVQEAMASSVAKWIYKTYATSDVHHFEFI
jgi:hypothetical protein